MRIDNVNINKFGDFVHRARHQRTHFERHKNTKEIGLCGPLGGMRQEFVGSGGGSVRPIPHCVMMLPVSYRMATVTPVAATPTVRRQRQGATMDDMGLAALLCTRLCHDVIGPAGATVNGIELMLDDSATVDEEVISIGPAKRRRNHAAPEVFPARARRRGRRSVASRCPYPGPGLS